MRIMFASDIHGSAYYCRKMLEAYRREGGRAVGSAGGSFVPWAKK